MTRLTLHSALTLWSLAGITFVGCGDGPLPTQSASESSRDQNPQTAAPDNDAERSQTYVTCRATLTAFKQDYAWFDDSSIGHDDGVAPLASFVLVEPFAHIDRTMCIFFKYSADAATASLPGEIDIGRQFTLEIPEEFLSGKSKIIDNASVRHFQKLDP